MTMSTGRRVRKTPQQRQQEIRTAAREIALTQGLNEVTTRALATRVGSAPGLISHYVPNMDALRAEMFGCLVAEELEAIKAETDATNDAIEAMGVLTRTLFTEGLEPTTGIWLDGWSLGRTVEVMAETVRDHMHAWQYFVVALIQRGQSEELFTVGDVDAAAWRIVGLIDGLNAHSLVQYRTPEARSEMLAQAIENELHPIRKVLDPTWS